MKMNRWLGVAAALLSAILLAGLAAAGAETLPSIAPHVHNWRYTAEGNAITAHCDGAGTCGITEGLTLVISAPNNLIYDGREKAAALKYGYSTEAFGRRHLITYTDDGGAVTNAAPIGVGTYTARLAPRMDVDAPVAEVTFTIAKADLTISQMPEPVNSAYDGKAHDLVTPPDNLPVGCEWIEYSIDDGVTWTDETSTGTEAGEYTVYVKYVGDANHNDRMGEPLSAVIDAKPGGIVLATLTAQGENALKLTWTQAKNVDGYDVAIKNVKDRGKNYTITSVEGTETSFTGLKAYNCYKARVRAWVMVGDTKQYVLDASPVVYAITGDYARGRVNPGSLKLSRSAVTVKIDRTVRIGGNVKGVKKGALLNRVSRLRYISSDTDVATVNAKGDVSGIGPGSCEIYVLTNNGIWNSVKITVDATPDSVWFAKKSGSLKVGGKGDLGARVKLWPGRSQTVLTWKSSNDAIATVDENGIVTGIKKGEATITVTASNGKSARFKVKVK